MTFPLSFGSPQYEMIVPPQQQQYVQGQLQPYGQQQVPQECYACTLPPPATQYPSSPVYETKGWTSGPTSQWMGTQTAPTTAPEPVPTPTPTPTTTTTTTKTTSSASLNLSQLEEEATRWSGHLPLTAYPVNDDHSPEIVTKRSDQQLLFKQQVRVRYLQPPTPPPPGPILVKQEPRVPMPVAPPIIIRQQAPPVVAPPPIVYREAPPPPPLTIPTRVITIPGKPMPPPPRKVIVERLAQMPAPPPDIIIERWLPYAETRRPVVFSGPTQPEHVYDQVKNLIVQWESPSYRVEREIHQEGVVRADPAEYLAKYGSSLTSFKEMPDFVKNIEPAFGQLAATSTTTTTLASRELEGDISALALVDLDKEGLSQYKAFVQTVLKSTTTTSSTASTSTASTTTSTTPIATEGIILASEY